MATNTTKLGLIKPDLTDIVDVGNLNDNADSIDAAVGFTVCTSATRPATPWSGQSIFETDTLSSFIWDGSTWQTAGGGGSITVSETAPTSPAPGNGDLWYSSTDGRTFVYYEDVDSSQWVEIGQVLGGGGTSNVASDCIQPNFSTISEDYTFDANYNGVSAGPVTIASGVTVTIGATSAWSIV